MSEPVEPFDTLSSAPGDGALERAVAANRRVIEALVGTSPTEDAAELLTRVSDQLEQIADELTAHAPAVDDRLKQMWSTASPRQDPVTGAENPLAPPLVLQRAGDGGVEGFVRLGLAHQGPPGHVHGGISALLLDHTLGVANHVAGASGVTARLSLDYRRPTPLFTELRVYARQQSVRGRKITTAGSISADGQVLVECEGLFIQHPLAGPGTGDGGSTRAES